MIVGEHPVWRYSIPDFAISQSETMMDDCPYSMYKQEIAELAEHRPFAASSAISRRFSQLVIFSSADPGKHHRSLHSFVYVFTMECSHLTLHDTAEVDH